MIKRFFGATDAGGATKDTEPQDEASGRSTKLLETPDVKIQTARTNKFSSAGITNRIGQLHPWGSLTDVKVIPGKKHVHLISPPDDATREVPQYWRVFTTSYDQNTNKATCTEIHTAEGLDTLLKELQEIMPKTTNITSLIDKMNKLLEKKTAWEKEQKTAVRTLNMGSAQFWPGFN